ncbi:MAG TPA: hypothetical protein VJA26_16865, partial [Gammaproteobacteria bacterium]|nr:hypothetical protein [Gammaproteobacteria bacterium]
FGGFVLTAIAFEFTVTPSSYSGSGSATLAAEFGGSGPVVLNISFAFGPSGFTVSGSTTVPEVLTFGSPAFLWMANPALSLDIATGNGAPFQVAIEVSVDTAVLFPELPSAILPPAGFATVTGLSGTLSSSGVIELSAATLSATPSPGLRFAAEGDAGTPGVHLLLGPGDTAPDSIFATLVNVVVTAPTLAFLPAISLATLALRRNGFELSGFALAPQDFDFEGILLLEQLSVASDAIRFSVDTGLSADVTIAATRGVFDGGTSLLSAEFTSLAATIDLDGVSAEFILSAASGNASIAGIASVGFQNVELHLGNAPGTPMFSVGSAVAAVPVLGDLEFTLTDLQIARDGSVSLQSAGVTSSNILTSFGLGGVLPFQLTSVQIVFPTELPDGRRSLDTIAIEVEGNFIAGAFVGLPFTPVLTMNGVDILAGETVTLNLHVDSLTEGRIAPIGTGAITLGFNDWDVVGATIDGLVELGGYDANGVLQPVPGISAHVRATLTVASTTFADLEIGAEAVALGTFNAAGNILDIAGAFNVDASGGTVSGKVRFDFTARITATPPEGFSTWSLGIVGSLSQVTISDLVIRLGNVIEFRITEAVLGDDPLTAPVELLVATESTVVFLAYPDAANFTVTLARLAVTTTGVVIDDLVVSFDESEGIVPDASSIVNFRLLADASFSYQQSGNTYTVSDLGASVVLTADSIEIFPNAPGGALFEAVDITGTFESSGELVLTATSAEASVAGVFDLQFSNLQFYLGADTERDRVSIGSVAATFNGLPGVTLSLTGFSVSNVGHFGIVSASVEVPNGFFQTIG